MLRIGIALSSSIDPEPFIVNEISLEAGLFDVAVISGGDLLNIRMGPSTKRGRYKILHTDDKVKIYGNSGKDAWLMTQEGYIRYDLNWEKIEAINQAGS
jgi:hypothetical protein